MKSSFSVHGLVAAVLVTGSLAHAQLSSPMPGVKPVQQAAPALSASAEPGVPFGTGPGVHSPNSPFAPLPQRSDVLAWSLLTRVTTRVEKNRILPVFEPAQLELNQQTKRLQGFMLPLEPGERQRHFLLSAVPLTCGFCTPGGPESMVEVKTRIPVKATMEPVVVEGRFQVLKDDPMGLYYRMLDAVVVR